MIDRRQVYFVNLEFTLRNGTVSWATHVTASDEQGAAELATEWFWEHMNYAGAKPKPRIRDVYVDAEGVRRYGVEAKPD